MQRRENLIEKKKSIKYNLLHRMRLIGSSPPPQTSRHRSTQQLAYDRRDVQVSVVQTPTDRRYGQTNHCICMRRSDGIPHKYRARVLGNRQAAARTYWRLVFFPAFGSVSARPARRHQHNNIMCRARQDGRPRGLMYAVRGDYFQLGMTSIYLNRFV